MKLKSVGRFELAAVIALSNDTGAWMVVGADDPRVEGEDLAREIAAVTMTSVEVVMISRSVRVTRGERVTDAFDLVGGRRNFDRDPALADLRTPDGGWITFSAVLRPNRETLEILAYTFERVFRSDAQPRFVRFDYNVLDHDNDKRGLRSHVHPGNDDMQLPSPILAPHELIELLLGEMGPAADRAPRTKGR